MGRPPAGVVVVIPDQIERFLPASPFVVRIPVESYVIQQFDAFFILFGLRCVFSGDFLGCTPIGQFDL